MWRTPSPYYAFAGKYPKFLISVLETLVQFPKVHMQKVMDRGCVTCERFFPDSVAAYYFPDSHTADDMGGSLVL